jgi:hypothetical protein
MNGGLKLLRRWLYSGTVKTTVNMKLSRNLWDTEKLPPVHPQSMGIDGQQYKYVKYVSAAFEFSFKNTNMDPCTL